MDLLDLPPELLGRIVRFSMPLDFENFMMTCRAVHACGRPHIATHNAHKRRWNRIFLNVHKDISAALKCLQKIAKDQVAAEYVESADFRGNGLDSSESDVDLFEEEKHVLHADSASLKNVKALVLQSPLLLHNSTGLEVWSDRVTMVRPEVYGDEPLSSWTLIFLLAQLRNVQELTLPRFWSTMTEDYPIDTGAARWQVLERLMRLSYEPQPHAPWARLKTLRLLDPINYDTRTALSSLSPFLAMKNIEQLYATSLVAVEDGYTGLPFTWPYPDLNSSLRRVELVSCCMDENGISNLLAHTPLLQSFKYGHSTKWHGCQHDWNAAAFVAAIGKNCGHHLTDLAITIDSLSGEIINGATSLKEFICLEHVELDIAIFAGPSIESGEQKGIEECSPAAGYAPWEYADVPKLVEMLPPSLRTLRLVDSWMEDRTAIALPLLKDFAAGRDWLLSDLEELSYHQRTPYHPLPEDVKGIQGVKAQAVANGFDYLSGGTLQAIWRRTFGEKHGFLVDDRD